MKEARRPNIIKHRARPAAERKDNMESYRSQIIAMLDTITDAKIMRGMYEIIKLVLMHADDTNKLHRLYEIIRACLAAR